MLRIRDYTLTLKKKTTHKHDDEEHVIIDK